MLRNPFILILLTFVGCTQPARHLNATEHPQSSITTSVSLPDGFSIIEQQPDGYFIRLASEERAGHSALCILADAFSGKFDRVDLCLNVAHERGDEYASIIGYQVFDHENDNIYSLNTISK